MSLRGYEERRAAIIGGALIPANVFGGIRAHVDIGAELGKSSRGYPWWSGMVLHFALWLVWFSPLLLHGRALTFGALSVPDREAALEELLASPHYLARQATEFLKLYLCMTFLGDVALLRRIGAYNLDKGVQPTRSAP